MLKKLRSLLPHESELYRQIRNGYYLLKGFDIDRFSAPVFWIRNIEDILKVQEISCRRKVNFILPVENCTWGAGFRYTIDSHPYCKHMIHDGNEDFLEFFYRRFIPRNVFDLYLIEDKPNKNSTVLSLPWTSIPKKKEIGEGGLLKEEGVQHYGPCSENKIDYESKRCSEIYNKISTNGYWPQRYAGYPRGYFMVHDNEYVFQITGSGQHRTAALAALGWKYVQCSSWNKKIKIVTANDSFSWPLVKSGELKSEEALTIFEKHLSDELFLQHKKLLSEI